MSKIKITGSEEEPENMDELFEKSLDRKQSVARVTDNKDSSGIVDDAGPEGEPGEPGEPGVKAAEGGDGDQMDILSELNNLLSKKAQKSINLGVKTGKTVKADCKKEDKQIGVERSETRGAPGELKPGLKFSNSDWLIVKAQNRTPDTSNYEKKQKTEQELVSKPFGLEVGEDPDNYRTDPDNTRTKDRVKKVKKGV
jgi:hypothetical protein